MAYRRLSQGLFLGLCVLCIVHAVYYYPQLPDKVATHFGPDGRPDAWSSKQAFFGVYMTTLSLSALVFLGIAFGISYVPVSMVSLPNRDYWLSPERKKETYSFIFHYFLWFACATILFLLDLMHQAFQVHLDRVDALHHPMLSLGLYLGFTALWCVGLFVKFARRPSRNTGPKIS
jgi:uncharacterized membrane protein